jgi:hypothetical protein
MASTGPTSPDGKKRSSKNALTHGLTAQTAVLPHEDPLAFEALLRDFYGHFGPRGPLECQLVDSLAATLFRLRRVPTLETALIKYRSRDAQMGRNRQRNFQARREEQGGRLPLTADVEFGKTVSYMLSEGAFDKLSRYEAMLFRQVELILNQLEKAKTERVRLGTVAPSSPLITDHEVQSLS